MSDAGVALGLDPVAEAARHWRDHGWGDAADGMAVVTSVFRVQQVLGARIAEALRPHDLTFARYEVLMLLAFSRHGALPLGKIGQRLQVHAGSITNAVDRLEAAGLVTRHRHPTDGRTTLARLTDDGRAVAVAATRSLNARVFEPLELDADRRHQVVDLLAELRRANGDFDT